MTTGEKIYELRKKARITQEEFADKLEVTRQAVSKWESDAAYPETDKIIKIAELFGVSCDYLLKENQVINDGTCGKQRRAFLSMMLSFAVACTVLGLVIAYVCYFAVDDWYSCLIGLGVLAGLILAAFILWSVGRYRFLLQCDYSEADKKHLATWTKAVIYTVVISLFLYLPSVVFVELGGYIEMGGMKLYYARKLSGGEFALSALVYGAAGYCVAALLNFAHGKILGKEFNAVKFTDAVCVAACVLAAVGAFSAAMYGGDELVYTILFGFAAVVSAAVIAQSIVHRIYEKTPLALFILQVACATLFFGILMLAYITVNTEFYSDELYITSLAFGGLVTAGSIAMLVIASVIAGKRKDYKGLLHIRLSVLTYAVFGALLIDFILGDCGSVGLLTATAIYAPVAALLHAPFIRQKN